MNSGAQSFTQAPFSGSYALADCQFLLKPIQLDPTPVDLKERMIQDATRHYSEMLAPESLPPPAYLELFCTLTDTHAERLGRDCLSLATHIANTRVAPITVVSLARAGTPIGALLTRALTTHLGVAARHYSISIIRDRGIDTNALRYLLRRADRPAAGVVFVDGWTAKGVITAELKAAVAQWNRTEPEQLDDRLYVVSDIGGVADVAASYDDYAIPSGILNATVSGLVSRSVLNHQIGADDFHGCVLYEAFAAADRSTWFLDRIAATFDGVQAQEIRVDEREARACQTRDWLHDCMAHHGIVDQNLVKPGVAEATRVLLRRVPEQLLLRHRDDPDVRHLIALAESRGVPIGIEARMPFRAAALIHSHRGATGAGPVRSNEP
ncbi:cysteine protease StiP family protein [uncultured Thiodictyon sp.]|uniref:cysteine protease StiP family protein n=1 Tax=uncultured Thiodictyon sp. TaxID=1846217 RepID=UPI0025D38A2C|nr:cysteine protease StiP family protein [uncultured Thiodictyon sp.]